MMNLAITLLTADRWPKPNYLTNTLLSLNRAGVLESGTSVTIFDSGIQSYMARAYIRDETQDASPHAEALAWAVNSGAMEVDLPDEQRSTRDNFVAAFRYGADGTDWLLVLEDDISVCKDFIGSIKRWMRTAEDGGMHLYSLFSIGKGRQGAWWDCPIDSYFSTTAILVRSNDALDLASYLEGPLNTRGPHGVDLAVVDWHKLRHPQSGFVRCSIPSLVQHEGRESTIREGSTFFPRSPTFTGEAWV